MATSLKPSRSMSPISSTAIPNRPVTDEGESSGVKSLNCVNREEREEEREGRKRGRGGREGGEEEREGRKRGRGGRE